MEKNYKDIGDDEIRFLGGDDEISDSFCDDERMPRKSKNKVSHSILFSFFNLRIISLAAIIIVVLCALFWLFGIFQKPEKTNNGLSVLESDCYETALEPDCQPATKIPLSSAEETAHSFIEIVDTLINDIPMRLYLPHHVSLSLHLGVIDRSDNSILFAVQAADVRADNGGIVGAFVLKGVPKAWGRSKKGYCAIINDTVTIGLADNSPLFEKATEREGYFFRQFPLVDKGQLVENEQRGKSIRRALCDRNGEIFTVETHSHESFHDFAQALADLGVDQAIYLVGSNAYGWAVDAEGQRHEFGNPDPPMKKWDNISYLVMREKN